MSAQAARIEALIRRRGEGTAITDTSRAARGWLAYFALPENLSAYTAAQALAHPILTSAAAAAGRRLPVRLFFRPINGIFKFRSTAQGTEVSLPTPMITFDAAAFTALAGLMFSRDRLRRKPVIQAMLGEDYQTVRAELESLGGLVEQPRGAYHDLSASFDRVNAQYFSGKMHRPHLTWSRSFTGRKFGHYDTLRDTVMVTASLDRPDVPQSAVDYLMFHELLHKKHGTRWRNGRGYAHTPAFYAEERRFPEYHQADAVLQRIASEQQTMA